MSNKNERGMRMSNKSDGLMRVANKKEGERRVSNGMRKSQGMKIRRKDE